LISARNCESIFSSAGGNVLFVGCCGRGGAGWLDRDGDGVVAGGVAGGVCGGGGPGVADGGGDAGLSAVSAHDATIAASITMLASETNRSRRA